MSAWTYANGIVTVSVQGRGQRAKDFVIGSVVDHLPPVTGSERDMHVEIVRRTGGGCTSNHDEFGQYSNIGRGVYSSERGHWFDEQDTYDLLLEGAFRDRLKGDTLREFSKWMTRLAKRVYVEDVLVRLSDCFGWSHVFDGAGGWGDMFDRFSYASGRLATYETRRWANFRYGIMPKFDGVGNWTENLINAVPGGAAVLSEVDYLAGNLEFEEYDDLGGSKAYLNASSALGCRMSESLREIRRWESFD